MFEVSGPEDDYYDAIGKYCGKFGYYGSLVATLLMLQGAITSQFINMTELLYPMCLALLKWIFDYQLPYNPGLQTFSSFSQQWLAIVVYIMMLVVCLKKDLSFFIKLSSYGSILLITISVFIITVGAYSFTNTNFHITSYFSAYHL